MSRYNHKVAIIGLGYVGLPLCLEFGKKYETIGFDINSLRVKQLNSSSDLNYDVDKLDLSDYLDDNSFTDDISKLNDFNTFIITVPTPVDKFKKPDLKFIEDASKMIAKILKKNDYVIYESTVYPGCTEEICIPILEKYSSLKLNKDFKCGYSPERINPGDKINTITKIVKVTSGSDMESSNIIDDLYSSIIHAGTYKAKSIRVAEASKAIENAQRDLNISFVNELAIIFDKMNIDTNDVVDAAGSKWNFLKFRPGLVGGHCIGVDPYYLTYKAESLGYFPKVIHSGRSVNENMSNFVVEKLVREFLKSNLEINNSSVLILGITFKENCSDIRNTRVVDMFHNLERLGFNVKIYDPLASSKEVYNEYDILLTDSVVDTQFDSIILAVAHDEFKKLNFNKLKKNKNSIIFDLKNIIDRNIATIRL